MQSFKYLVQFVTFFCTKIKQQFVFVHFIFDLLEETNQLYPQNIYSCTYIKAERITISSSSYLRFEALSNNGAISFETSF